MDTLVELGATASYGYSVFELFAMTASKALRLNLFKVYDSKRGKEIKMTKTMNIEGMMCGHCETRVKKTLEGLEAVDKAEVNHEKGTAVVTLCGNISDDELKKAVEEQDYTVTSIE